MIKLTIPRGDTVYLAASAIAEIHEAGVSSRWHGIRAYVKTFDGRTIEAQEDVHQIARMVEQEGTGNG